MEIIDFPKGTKPRDIFIYTCERIAEPLIPLGYKYRKSKNDIYKIDGIFTFKFRFDPSIRLSSTYFTIHFEISCPNFAHWCNEREETANSSELIVGTTLARLTKRDKDFPLYDVNTLSERERSIKEICDQIQDYAIPFFQRFTDLEKLANDVEIEGFFPHRKGFDFKKHNEKVVAFFREQLLNSM